jgi:hypothetical protein
MISCAYDLLKNKGLDKTTLVALCLILKLFMGLDKFGSQGFVQKLTFLSLTNHGTIFCYLHKLSKSRKMTFFVHQTPYKTKIVQ